MTGFSADELTAMAMRDAAFRLQERAAELLAEADRIYKPTFVDDGTKHYDAYTLTIEPSTCGGAVRIPGTRLSTEWGVDILASLGSFARVATEGWPEVTRGNLLACLWWELHVLPRKSSLWKWADAAFMAMAAGAHPDSIPDPPFDALKRYVATGRPA